MSSFTVYNMLTKSKNEEKKMTQFDKYVESLAQRGRERRLNAANLALQKSLRERTEEEVYDSIYRRLGVAAQKQPVVLA